MRNVECGMKSRDYFQSRDCNRSGGYSAPEEPRSVATGRASPAKTAPRNPWDRCTFFFLNCPVMDRGTAGGSSIHNGAVLRVGLGFVSTGYARFARSPVAINFGS